MIYGITVVYNNPAAPILYSSIVVFQYRRVGADGTTYSELDGFGSQQHRRNQPSSQQVRINKPIYADMDHTLSKIQIRPPAPLPTIPLPEWKRHFEKLNYKIILVLFISRVQYQRSFSIVKCLLYTIWRYILFFLFWWLLQMFLISWESIIEWAEFVSQYIGNTHRDMHAWNYSSKLSEFWKKNNIYAWTELCIHNCCISRILWL